MSYILQVKNVRKTFSNKTALDDVSLALKKGTIFGLLGPNGAGKTTLIRIINSIIKADGGSVVFNEQEDTPTLPIHIGYLPEERGLYKKMKVGAQLLYLAQLKGLSKTKAIEQIDFWLAKFGIESWKNKTVEELSKGMAQKVQFIATVVHEPQLLILDEPFSGFDPINTELIKNELLELKKKGVSIILSTHNMNSVEELCDEIVIVDKGKIVLSGNIDTIRTNFSNKRFEILFSGNMISFSTALWTGFELIHHETLEDKRIKAIVEGGSNNSINELLHAILPSCSINYVKEVIPSMHEIFIQHVQSEINSEVTE